MSLRPQETPQQLNPGAGAGRRQVALTKGHSMMDWVRLGKRMGGRLAGASRGQPITPEMLAAHADPDGDEIWMSLRGRVYNITPYLDFHPGGRAELLRGAGIEATQLFNEVHAWVNAESMLAKCYIGPLVRSSNRPPPPTTLGSSSSSTTLSSRSSNNTDTIGNTNKSGERGGGSSSGDGSVFKVPAMPRAKPNITTLTTSSSLMDASATTAAARSSPQLPPQLQQQNLPPPPPPPQHTAAVPPGRDWYQSNTEVTLTLYCGGGVSKDAVAVHTDGAVLQLDVDLDGAGAEYALTLALGGTVKRDSVRVTAGKRALRITMVKAIPAQQQQQQRWSILGDVLAERFVPPGSTTTTTTTTTTNTTNTTTRPVVAPFTDMHLVATETLTHDTVLMWLSAPPGSALLSPLSPTEARDARVGQHVRVRAPNGHVRSYTCVSLPCTASVTPVAAGPRDRPNLCLLVKGYPMGVLSSWLCGLATQVAAAAGGARTGEGEGNSVIVSVPVPVPVSRPLGGLTYDPSMYDAVGMIAAGTGLAPMLGIIARVAAAAAAAAAAASTVVTECSYDHPPATLLLCNRSEQDIPLREALEAVPSRFLRTTHLLSSPSTTWGGARGRLGQTEATGLDLLAATLPAPGPRALVLVCGPPSFTQTALALLDRAGYSSSSVHAFT